MKNKHTFSLMFYLRRDRISGNRAPIFLRITVDGKHALMSTKKYGELAKWNQKRQKYAGNTTEDLLIKEKIRLMANEANSIYDDLYYEGETITALVIKSRMEGKGNVIDEVVEVQKENKEEKTLKELISYHYEVPGQLLAEGTLKNYRSTEKFLLLFLQKKKEKDISLSKIDFKFLTDFSVYLRLKKVDKGQKKCTNNTVMKHMERFQKMMTLAMKFGWITVDPFLNYERHIVSKDRTLLEEDEVERLKSLQNLVYTHGIVRDMFLFSCYTGLGFGEISTFSKGNLKKDQNGDFWIQMTRPKTFKSTERKFNVYLLPEARELIEKYKNHPLYERKKTIFPCLTNQSSNRILKKLADMAEIYKKLTYHCARHYFATVVTLENGVSIEAVSHMLGHSSIRTTQVYSKVQQKKIAKEMKKLILQ